MYIRKTFPADSNGISELVSFTEELLARYKVDEKKGLKAALVVEEAAGGLVRYADQAAGGTIELVARGRLGTVTIEMSADGTEYSFADAMASEGLGLEDDVSEDVQDTIRAIILKSFADDIKYRHKNGRNSIRMTIVRSRRAFLYQTLGAMVVAIILGIVCDEFLPETFNTDLNAYLLTPVKTMYMNALKMVVAPVVFFSIISCIVQFSDLRALGRIGAKILSMYFFTTMIAVFVGIGVFYVFQPGDASLAEGLVADASSITSQSMDVSIKDTIVGIVPSNVIDPFQKEDMLQIIFMAVLIGIAAGLIGKYSAMLKDMFAACNDLFLKIVSLIIRVMPVAVFCSFMSMMLTMGIATVISVMGMLGTFVIGLCCMMVCYCILMVVIGRLNPLPFLRKYAPCMIQIFSMASSNAAIPVNMEACDKKLGVERRVFSLSIPLGATVNMDGTCVHLSVFALALAKTYGIAITGGSMLSMVISIIVLSIGAPGIPGAGLICLSVLLTQMGVPVEAIGLVMGIDSLCGMFRAMSNTLGDVVVTTIVAKSEKALDMETYYESI